MQIKEVKPMIFFYHSVRTDVSGLAQYVSVVAKALHKEAAIHDIEVTGPVYWQYTGFDGKDNTVFTLDIALPVAEAKSNYQGKFAFKDSGSFRCVSAVHEGSWYEMPRTYGKIFTFIQEQHLQPIELGREVYLNMDFKSPEANATEVQIGIH